MNASLTGNNCRNWEVGELALYAKFPDVLLLLLLLLQNRNSSSSSSEREATGEAGEQISKRDISLTLLRIFSFLFLILAHSPPATGRAA